jgi:ABC-type cobalamin/Fe3+-siderophores transport system ATPase subunit
VPLVLDVCDELWVLDAGRVIAHGEPKNVVAQHEVVEAYLGRVDAPRSTARKPAARRRKVKAST